MNEAMRLVSIVSATVLLGGCVAAAMPMMIASLGASTAVTGYGLYKVVQTSTGGSIEVGINDTKLTNEQRIRLKAIRSMAVWPDKVGTGAVVFAETLQQSGRFEVITPAQVSAVLKKLNLPDDVEQMTTSEAKAALLKVGRETNAESVVISKTVGGRTEMNMWSFDRAHQSQDFIVLIYDRDRNSYLAELPGTIKILMGGTIPSNAEISTLVNTELAKAIVTLAQNPELAAMPAREPTDQVASDKPKGYSQGAADEAAAPKPMSAKEVQERLIALGYKPGTPDGVMGKRTVDALKAFQRDKGIPVTGQIDDQTLRKLQSKERS